MKSEHVHEAWTDSVTSSYNSPSTYPSFRQSPSMKNYKYFQIKSMQAYLKKKNTNLLKMMVI